MKHTLALCIVGMLLLCSCNSKSTSTSHQIHAPDGQLKESTYSVNGEVREKVRRIFEKETLRGVGEFSHPQMNMARDAALSIAQVDLAEKAGEVIASRDTTIYNNEIQSIIQTKSKNIISGYEIIFEKYHKESSTYEIMIELSGFRVAEQIVKHL